MKTEIKTDKEITTQFSSEALLYLSHQYSEFDDDIKAFENVTDCSARSYFGDIDDLEDAVTQYLYHELGAIRLENGNLLVPAETAKPESGLHPDGFGKGYGNGYESGKGVGPKITLQNKAYFKYYKNNRT